MVERQREIIREDPVAPGGPRNNTAAIILAVVLALVALVVVVMLIGGGGGDGTDEGGEINVEAPEAPEAEAPEVEVPDEVDVNVDGGGEGAGDDG